MNFDIQEIREQLEAGADLTEVEHFISKSDYEKCIQRYPDMAKSIPDSVLAEQLVNRGFYILPARVSDVFDSLTEEEQDLIFKIMNRVVDGNGISSPVEHSTAQRIRKKTADLNPGLFEEKQ